MFEILKYCVALSFHFPVHVNNQECVFHRIFGRGAAGLCRTLRGFEDTVRMRSTKQKKMKDGIF